MNHFYSIHQFYPQLFDWSDFNAAKAHIIGVQGRLRELCSTLDIPPGKLTPLERNALDDEYTILNAVTAAERQHAVIINHLANNNDCFHERKLLVIDFDDTLVYSHTYDPQLEAIAALHYNQSPRSYEEYMAIAPSGGVGDGLSRRYYARPFLTDFLNTVSNWGFDLAIYSSATYPYIANIANLCQIDLKRFLFIWPRGYCEHEGDRGYPKPVKKCRAFGYRLRNILQIDDDEFSLGPKPNNGLAISPFHGSSSDTVLRDILSEVSHYRTRDVVEFNRQKDFIQTLGSMQDIEDYATGCADSVLIGLASERRDLLVHIKRHSLEHNKRLLADYQEKLTSAETEKDRQIYQRAISATSILLAAVKEWLNRNS